MQESRERIYIVSANSTVRSDDALFRYSRLARGFDGILSAPQNRVCIREPGATFLSFLLTNKIAISE